MGWLATLHGDLSHLSHEDRAAAEIKVRDALAGVAGDLTGDGHVGVAATFHGDTTGDVNLLSPGDTPDTGPAPSTPGEVSAAQPVGQVPADAVEPPESGETGADVERAPGTASEPTPPPEGIDPETGQETPAEGSEGQE